MSVIELNNAFFSLIINKSSGYNNISFNVVRNCFGSLLKPLMDVFNLPLEKWNFPDDLKIDQVTGIFKACDKVKLESTDQSQFFHAFQKY